MLAKTTFERIAQSLQDQGKLGPGRIFYVGNGTAQHQQNGASDDTNRGLSSKEPLATIDYATGLCTAGRGDNVVILPGHTETLDAAGGITSDVADVTYWGLGKGTSRPTITMGSADTATTWVVSAANVHLHNLKVDVGMDELVVAFPVTGANFRMTDCRCIVADSSAQCVQWMTLSAAADEAYFDNCEFIGDTANGTANLEVLSVAAVTGLTIKNTIMEIIGAAAVGPIHFTGAATQVYMENCYFRNNIASATACIDCDALAVTGLHKNCTFVLGTIATAGTGITPVVCASGMFVSDNSGVINDQNESDAIVGSASTA